MLIKNSSGKTPFFIARESKNNEIAYLVKPVSTFEEFFCFIDKPQMLVKRSNDLILYIFLTVSIFATGYASIILGSFHRLLTNSNISMKDVVCLLIVCYNIFFLVIFACFQLFCRKVHVENSLDTSLSVFCLLTKELSERTNHPCLTCKVEINLFRLNGLRRLFIVLYVINV